MKYDAALDRDANRFAVTSNEAFKVENTITFAAATTGSVASHTLFEITGNVLVQIFGICDTNLDSGGAATIEVGVAGNTAAIIAQTTATGIDDGEIWVDSGSAVGAEAIGSVYAINDGADIIYTIGTATVTAGVIDFYCLWRPLSSTGSVTAGTGAATA